MILKGFLQNKMQKAFTIPFCFAIIYFNDCGGVAQLGERTVRIRKVESSILFVSTTSEQA